MQHDLIEPGYFDLQALAAYSSCSVRSLKDRLVDRVRPLSHYRIEGKILAKREVFDRWLSGSHVDNSADALSEIVGAVAAHMQPSKRSA